MKRVLVFMLVLCLAAIASAQDETPSVTVNDQVSVDGMVTIERIYSETPAFIVIHAEGDEGGPGPVIGFREVNQGVSNNVSVAIDTSSATTTLFAMLHVDTGEIGVYEFGTVEGVDGPVFVDEAPVTPPFAVEIVRAYDQIADMNTVTIADVVTQQDGFVVIHAEGDEGGPGPVIGFAPVSAGANSDVVVDIDAEGMTETIFPMLHVDTGEAGEYEFGTVEGADGPVVIDGVVAVFPIGIANPAMRVPDQIVTDTVVAESVVSAGLGWLVIHAASEEGTPGPVIGFAQVEAGTNVDVVVEVDPEGVTPVLFPMLHVDTAVEGEYEFGTVEGADGPVFVDENVLVFPINAAPSITLNASLDMGVLTVEAALIDAQGWLAIHSDVDGAPGPVVGVAPLTAGMNQSISVDVEGEATSYFPMLHYDTGEAGVYEFGTVEGVDLPVFVNEAVVVGNVTVGE